MKKILAFTIAAMGILSPGTVSAQYYEIANQLPNLITPALSGSMNYKGYVEGHYLKGVGDYKADFYGISTSQGFRYASWFFMGVGIGVDGITAHADNDFGNWDNPDYSYTEHGSRSSGVMIPIFTDFRFNIGNPSSVAFTAGIKIGCSFLMGQDYLEISDGYITNQEYFYLRPSIGVRIPISKTNSKQAVNFSADYQLLTSNYWSSWARNITLNGLGISASFEW